MRAEEHKEVADTMNSSGSGSNEHHNNKTLQITKSFSKIGRGLVHPSSTTQINSSGEQKQSPNTTAPPLQKKKQDLNSIFLKASSELDLSGKSMIEIINFYGYRS